MTSGPFLTSIDPGLNACGVAVWNTDKQLEWAGYVKNRGENFVSMVNSVAIELQNRFSILPSYLVTELPQVYVRSRSKGDPNDLISLSCLVGALAFDYASRDGYRLYKPAEWKGQLDKKVLEYRVKKHLTPKELTCVELPSAKSVAHNVWDGLGLGLRHSNRL